MLNTNMHVSFVIVLELLGGQGFVSDSGYRHEEVGLLCFGLPGRRDGSTGV